MKKRIVAVIFLVLVLAVTGLIGCDNNGEKQIGSDEVYEVQRGDLFISVPVFT